MYTVQEMATSIAWNLNGKSDKLMAAIVKWNLPDIINSFFRYY